MGWAGVRGSRGEREDQNGLKPDGGSEIGTNLDTGLYPRTNDFADSLTATDLHSAANRHTKANLYSSPALAHIHPATYGYAQADSRADAGSHCNAHPGADPDAYFHATTNADAHADSRVSAIHQRNSRTTLE